MEREQLIPVGSVAKLRKSSKLALQETIKPLLQLEHSLQVIEVSMDRFLPRPQPPHERRPDELLKRPVLIMTTDEEKRQSKPLFLAVVSGSSCGATCR